jgi:hypothetical protein
MYVVTVETPLPGQAWHTYLRSYRGNLNNVCVCLYIYYISVVVPVVIVETLIMCMYVYYTVVLLPNNRCARRVLDAL